MNQKGQLVLKTLVVIIVAILVFVPSCMFISGFFRVSAQAKESFLAFHEEIEQFSKEGQLSEKKTSIIIMDKQSFIGLFHHSQAFVNLGMKEIDVKTGCVAFLYPENSCKGKACLCLCQEYELKKEQNQYCPHTAFCKKTYCQELEGNYEMSWSTVREKDDFRRSVVSLEKGEKVSISGGKKFVHAQSPTSLEVTPVEEIAQG